jgi:hypothetical protein
MRYGKTFSFAVAAGLVGVLGYGVRSADAGSSQQTIYTYFDDATYYNTVGEGATSCGTGKFHMLWGCKTAYYVTTTERCPGNDPPFPASVAEARSVSPVPAERVPVRGLQQP